MIVDNGELERRLDRICESLESAVATAPHTAVLWDRVRAFPADLIVIERSSLTDPIEATIETIRALPERPESLVEGELFGYMPGAFTGAVGTRRGCFELAHGGTIFLDEIGELPQHIQVKLLRVLQERVIQRLGSEDPFHVNVRVMAATNRDLLEEVKSDGFRQDLYYRLSVVTLEIPPLRQHTEDIAKLANRYLDAFRLRLNSNVSAFSDEAMQALVRYPWPGNIRELINVVERAVLLCEGEHITVDDLPRTIAPAPQQAGNAGSLSSLDVLFEGDWQSRPWKDIRNAVISSCEQTYFIDQLGKTNGNVEETARRSGINPRSLYDLMKRHGLKKEYFRASAE